MSWRCAVCSKENDRFDVVCQTCCRPKGHVPASARLQLHERHADDTCCVCWEKTGDRTECGHAVCASCWRSLLDKRRCPVCRIDFVVGPHGAEIADEIGSPSSCSRFCCTVGGGRRVLEALRQLSSRPGLTLAPFAAEASRHAATMEHLHRTRLVSDQERERFYTELRAAIRGQVSRLGQLSDTVAAETVLSPLRARCIIGDSELMALRKRASQLLPHRKMVRPGVLPCGQKDAAQTRHSGDKFATYSEELEDCSAHPTSAGAEKIPVMSACSESAVSPQVTSRRASQVGCVSSAKDCPVLRRGSRPAWWWRYKMAPGIAQDTSG